MPNRRRDFLATASKCFAVTAATTVVPNRLLAADSIALTDLDAFQAIGAMRNGEIRAENYAKALLDRAAQVEGLNAFVTLDREMVLEASRAADKKRDAGSRLGALHGLPIPVKDSVNTSTLPTTNGTAALKNFRPKSDAPLLKSLFAQGAILMGKTGLHELSFGWTCNNQVFGAIRNPYDPSRIPGGSSGGSGVVVAAHVAPLSVAEDTLGSIRVPASMCGIAGFRPSVGRYIAGGVMPITPKWDVVGPLARSVADLILFDSVATGDTSPVLPTSLQGVRIAVAEYLMNEVHPDVARVATDVLKKLESAGAEIVWADFPENIRAGLGISRAVHLFEAGVNMTAFLAEHNAGTRFEEVVSEMSPDLQAVFRDFLVPGAPKAITQELYDTALQQLTVLRKEMRQYFSDNRVSVLAFPSMRLPATKIGEDREIDILGQKLPMRVAMARNHTHGSLAGMPCLVLPGGLSSDGLPIGIEFDALPGQDRKLLALGLSLEKVLGRIPPPKVVRFVPAEIPKLSERLRLVVTSPVSR